LARKVLLADDSVTAQNMGRRILVDAGYEVITVNNGSSALKKVAESKPDLIVLDVYMPGYGGLEVCQRIRESQETARIPVLLTVGKLEPFKAEEATRVRADAFIVKPFEASELLTALTKLEDKIVPQPGNRKSGRSKASDDAAYVKEFGDVETGWKNRLKIPAPHQPRANERVTASDEPNEPRDSTSDAAPAATPTAQEQPQAEVPTAAVGPETNTAEDSSPPSEVSAQETALALPKAHEDEVAAALASLLPSNGHGSEATVTEPEAVPVTMAAAVAAQEFSGPRWIAQEIALPDDESSLILEQEMHKALAALAAADAASLNVSSTETAPQTMVGSQVESEAASAGARLEEPSSFASMSDGQESATGPADFKHESPAAAEPEPDEPARELSAYAAAASAGASAQPQEATVEAVSASQPAAYIPETSTAPEPTHDADLAAAWASWKQVRDSVSTPEFTSQIADAAATGFKEIRHEEATATPESETASAPAEENGAIASIVDSVLAELKPKLMEEISKKMKKQK